MTRGHTGFKFATQQYYVVLSLSSHGSMSGGRPAAELGPLAPGGLAVLPAGVPHNPRAGGAGAAARPGRSPAGDTHNNTICKERHAFYDLDLCTSP